MVLPILFLTAGLILTFGGTASRLLDRLRLSARKGIVLQFLLVGLAVAPHITVEIQSWLAFGAYLALAGLGAGYLFANAKYLRPNLAAGLFGVTAAMTGLFALFFFLELPSLWTELLAGIFLGGLAFLVSANHESAFVTVLLADVLACGLLLAAGRINGAALLRTAINSAIYGLFLGLILMNLFKRVRGNYVTDIRRERGLGRRRTGLK